MANQQLLLLRSLEHLKTAPSYRPKRQGRVQPAANTPAAHPENSAARPDKPAQPTTGPETNRAPTAQPTTRPETNRPEPAQRSQTPPPSERSQPQRTPPPAETKRPTQERERPQPGAQKPEEKKQKGEQPKKDEKPPQ